jgi:hypothetical protein
MVGVAGSSTKIVIKGSPIVVEFKAEGATVEPGFMVQMTTSNVEIKIGGAATGTKSLGIGIAGYESAQPSYKPATIATAYADNAFIPVIVVGSGVIVMAQVSGVIALGGALTSQAAAGALVTATIGTNHIYAININARTAAAVSLSAVVLL